MRERSLGARPDVLACLFAVSCLLTDIGSSAAQAGDQRWTKLATEHYVLINKQDALAFVGPTGWYGNGTGKVFRTHDFGEHWQSVWKNPGTYVRALEFVDENIGFLGNVGPGYFPNVADKHPL